MSIETGETIVASDFVFEEEAGQDLADGDAALLGDGADSGTTLLEISSNDDASQICSGSTWVAQKVRFSAVRNVTHVSFRHGVIQSQTHNVKIRSSLTGSDLATGSVTPGSTNGSIVFRQVELDSPVSLSADTDYYIIFTGSYTVYGQSTSTFASGEAHVSTDSGASWSTHGSIADLGVLCVGGLTTAGKLYKAVASAPELFVGFVQGATSSGVNARINPSQIVTNLSGLTAGDIYYLSDTPGSLSTSGSYKVGIALTATKLLRDYTRS